MSDLCATVTETPHGFHVEAYIKISYDFIFLDGVFSVQNPQLADLFRRWGRCLALVDVTVCELYGQQISEYFAAYGIDLEMHKMTIGEQSKSVGTSLSISEIMNEFGLVRREPVLVVGGGLTTDVAGYTCATYHKGVNFICIPTTLVGLVDASVSIKVGVNHGKRKNEQGAYHAASCTFLDFTFLRTLPEAQVRSGFAELVKISACADLPTFTLLEEHCEALISHKFGRGDGSSAELKAVADKITHRAVHVMLQLEAPNLHEIELDRVLAYGHTWSPTLELAPETPLRHGHAVAVDMAYSATLALSMGLISADDRHRIVRQLSHAGLAVDHPLLDEALLAAGTEAIIKKRDGKLRAPIPRPLGRCIFVNDVTAQQMNDALSMHKEYCKLLPRAGAGVDAYVGTLDTVAGEVNGGDVGVLGSRGERGRCCKL